MKIMKAKTRQSRLTGKNKKGFSILEVLVAFFVLLTGILGILMMITNSIKDSAHSRDVISASQLAQEGIELVRWVRDNNVERDAPFDEGMGSNIIPNCRVDFSVATQPTPVLDCSSTYSASADFSMYYNKAPSSSFYFFNNNSPTTNPVKFKRMIKIEGYTSATERIIKSFVFWGSNSDYGGSALPDESNCYDIKKCVYAIGKITNWDE